MRMKFTLSLLALAATATMFMSVGATAHPGPIVDLGSGAVELPIPDIGGIVSGSAGGVLNSVAPLRICRRSGLSPRVPLRSVARCSTGR